MGSYSVDQAGVSCGDPLESGSTMLRLLWATSSLMLLLLVLPNRNAANAISKDRQYNGHIAEIPLVLGMEPIALHVLDQCSTTELSAAPDFFNEYRAILLLLLY